MSRLMTLSLLRAGIFLASEFRSERAAVGRHLITVLHRPLYKIVADIRKKIAEDDYPGEPDPSNNFTGFWKEDCEQAFGLQIMPYGKDGKYSVTFCGPGGCGTAGEDGKNTFITKDPDYEVVSESKIKVRNVDNGWDTYYRCTRDTHLILKYKQQ